MKTAKKLSRGHRAISRQEIMTSGKQNRKYSMTRLRFESLKNDRGSTQQNEKKININQQNATHSVTEDR